MNGGSTGRAPNQVSRIMFTTKAQNMNLFILFDWLLEVCGRFIRGSVNRAAIDMTRATTPPSLLGIDRRIA